jgi:hypothetical protein
MKNTNTTRIAEINIKEKEKPPVQREPTRKTLNQRPDVFSEPRLFAEELPQIRGGRLTIAGVDIADRSLMIKAFRIMNRVKVDDWYVEPIAGEAMTAYRKKRGEPTIALFIVWADRTKSVFYGEMNFQ